MLLEQGAVPDAALPVAELIAHLRIGTGFASDGLQEGLLRSHLRAALAAIEGRIGKALLTRRYLWTLEHWREGGAVQALPIGPVAQVIEVALVTPLGGRVVLPAGQWRLRTDLHRPKLEPVGLFFPPIPQGGQAEVTLDAGFGVAWAAVPADLRQAVLMLAAEFYDLRHDGGEAVNALPRSIQGLIERWRTVRVLGGGAT